MRPIINHKSRYLDTDEAYFADKAISNSDLKIAQSLILKIPVIRLQGNFLEVGKAIHGSITGIEESKEEWIQKTKERFWNNPLVQNLFSGKKFLIEQGFTFLWQKNMCKAKPDWFSLDGEGVLIDLKSTASSNQEGFEKTVHEYGYLQQMAFYAKGIEKAFGLYPKHKWILGVTKTKKQTKIFSVCVENKELHRYENICRYTLNQINKSVKKQIYESKAA